MVDTTETLPTRPCVPTLAEQVEGLTAAVHKWMECYEGMRVERDRLAAIVYRITNCIECGATLKNFDINDFGEICSLCSTAHDSERDAWSKDDDE